MEGKETVAHCQLACFAYPLPSLHSVAPHALVRLSVPFHIVLPWLFIRPPTTETCSFVSAFYPAYRSPRLPPLFMDNERINTTKLTPRALDLSPLPVIERKMRLFFSRTAALSPDKL